MDHWKLNCPELREVTSRQQQRSAIEEWSQQIDEKKKVQRECV